MSVNRNRPHLMVLPEDDANLRMANGFHLGVDITRYRQMQVLPVAGGWQEVLNLFNSEHVREMERWPERLMVLLIDFDGNENRLEIAKAAIPQHLAGRVFIVGALSKPEDLKGDLGPYETIGSKLANDCSESVDGTWGHRLLRHNAPELDRLRERARSILF